MWKWVLTSGFFFFLHLIANWQLYWYIGGLGICSLGFCLLLSAVSFWCLPWSVMLTVFIVIQNSDCGLLLPIVGTCFWNHVVYFTSMSMWVWFSLQNWHHSVRNFCSIYRSDVRFIFIYYFKGTKNCNAFFGCLSSTKKMPILSAVMRGRNEIEL